MVVRRKTKAILCTALHHISHCAASCTRRTLLPLLARQPTARRDAGAKRRTVERRTYHSIYKMATAATPTRTRHRHQRFDNKCLHHPCAGHNAGRTRRQPSAGMAPFRRRHGRLVISQPTAPPRQHVCADLPTRSDHTNHSPPPLTLTSTSASASAPATLSPSRYYYNENTQETTWDKPQLPKVKEND